MNTTPILNGAELHTNFLSDFESISERRKKITLSEKTKKEQKGFQAKKSGFEPYTKLYIEKTRGNFFN